MTESQSTVLFDLLAPYRSETNLGVRVTVALGRFLGDGTCSWWLVCEVVRVRACLLSFSMTTYQKALGIHPVLRLLHSLESGWDRRDLYSGSRDRNSVSSNTMAAQLLMTAIALFLHCILCGRRV